MTEDLREVVLRAAARPEVVEAVARVHEALERAIAARRPRCDASGRCCRFEEYGHRMYVTTMELAAFVARLGERGREDVGWDGMGCPFQVDGLCSVHGIRPFGCRVFFCDSTAQVWQQDQYAAAHAEMKRLHEEFGVPYAYIEWREGLALAGACPDPVRPTPVVRRLNLLTTRPPG